MAKLTIKQLEALKHTDDKLVLREAGGLVGRVRSGVKGVTVQFRYEFSLNGTKRDHSLGSWPKTTLANLRAQRDQVMSLVEKGIHPAQAKKAEKLRAQAEVEAIIAEGNRKAVEQLTFSDLFYTWIDDGVARQDGNAELVRSFKKDALPLVGSKLLSELNEKDLLTVLRNVSARGVDRSVVILYKNIGQMLRWGEKRKPWRGLMLDGNPADLIDIDQLLSPDYSEERDRILSPNEIRELHDTFVGLEKDYAELPSGQKYSGVRPVNRRIQIAMWICLSTLCRIGELIKTEWKDVNLEKRTWLIRAVNTKGKRRKRRDHHVFLSPFALEKFTELYNISGSQRWLFPGRNDSSHVDVKSFSKLIGDRQCRFKNRTKELSGRHNNNSLVLGNGMNGEWTPHDLRRSGATMMQELGIGLDIIDRCQNHVLSGSKVRRHYLHHDYADEKRAAWDKLGLKLEEFLQSPK